MASIVTNAAKNLFALGAAPWADGGTTYRAMLLSASHVQDPADEFVADVVANEVADASYSRQDVTGRTATLNGGGESELKANNTVWAGLDVVTPAFVAVYKFVTNDADSPLIAILELSATPTADGTNYTVAWPSGVVCKIA